MTVNLQQCSRAGDAVRFDEAQRCALNDLAERLLFAPLRELLTALPSSGPSTAAALNALLTECAAGRLCAPSIRFIEPDALPIAYEERIVTRGEVVTRPGSWHDFFNALVWMRFPHTKRALAEIHAEGIRAGASDGRRGPVRDAATQFDESGVVVAASDARLLDLLAARCWKELFWARREELRRRVRFVVFGHGLYDALRAPFYRICGRAALVTVSQALIEAPVDVLCEHLDPILAERFARRTFYPRPKVLLALPLLGIPGVCGQNEDPAYYDDDRQFRPLPEA